MDPFGLDHCLRSVWINRRHDRLGRGSTPVPTGDYSFDAEFPSKQAFVEAARAAKHE